MDKIGSYEFLAEPFHCDFSQRLFMGHLGNHMLNAADFHSSARGFGMKYLMTINRSWVLSRLAIEMDEMPQQYTNSRIYGYGRSIWAMIDTQSRQPTDIFSIDNGAINQWIVKDKDCPIDKGGRVKMTDEAQYVRTIDTYYNDVDINGHINSVKYIEHILDLWPLNWYRTHCIRRFEIAYVAEAHQGDKLSFFMENFNQDKTNEVIFYIRITKTSSDNPEMVEVCRSKVVFVTK